MRIGFQSKQLPWLPPTLDLRLCTLKGSVENYSYVRDLGAGAQGSAMLFAGSETGECLVLKHYIPGKSSTNCRRADAYWVQMNEREMLEYLSVVNRVGAFTSRLSAEGLLRFDGSKAYVGDEYIDNDLLMLAGAWSSDAHTLSFGVMPCPLVQDYVDRVIDKHGVEFLPHLQPRSQVLAYNLSTGTDSKCLLMTYASGQTVQEILAHRLLTMDEAASIVRSVAKLHRHGVVHRDLKPDNLVLRADGSCCALDYGIAQLFKPSDRVAVLAGTPDLAAEVVRATDSHFISREWGGSRIYSSPTSFAGEAHNTDDIFSLGLILATGLLGKHPFMDITFAEYAVLERSKAVSIHREIQRRILTAAESGTVRKQLQGLVDKLALPDTIRQMCHLTREERTPRLTLVMTEFGLAPERYPPSFDPLEFSDQKDGRFSLYAQGLRGRSDFYVKTAFGLERAFLASKGPHPVLGRQLRWSHEVRDPLRLLQLRIAGS